MKSSIPNIIRLQWRKDAAEYWFKGLTNKPWAMLLHSGYANHLYNRFDIIVADPIIKLLTDDNITKITSFKNKTITSNKDPLTLLELYLKNISYNYNNLTFNPDIPFQGGALGLFSYDLVRRFEKLPNLALNDINIPYMAVGIYDWAIIIDHYKQVVSLLSYNNPHDRLSWLYEQNKTKLSIPAFKLTSDWQSNMTLEEYAEKFFCIQKYLYSGDCYQVNLAQRFNATYEGDEWQVFTSLNSQNKAPFSAFIRLEHSVIMSFSPERFIKLVNGVIQTRPIKGTLPRLVDMKLDLLQIDKLKFSEKDITENLMIVDLMRNDIGKVAEPGSVKVTELFIVEKFQSVYHLVSTITAKILSSSSCCDLLRSAFPGGSITGAPKIKAMEIIEEQEPHRRNAWCGTIGYLSLCKSMDTNISIRTLTAYKKQLYCSAGGGIIVDSKLEAEYKETFYKVKNILQHITNLYSYT